MGQNLGRRKTQTATHTPIGHNGADSMGRLFTGSHPVSSVRNTTLCWRCGMTDKIWPRCGSFSEGRRKRRGRSRSCVRSRRGKCWRKVFYLFYLRLVQLPHQLVRGAPSNRWWAEHNEVGRSGRGFPLLLLFIALSHSNMVFTTQSRDLTIVYREFHRLLWKNTVLYGIL